MLKIGSVSRNNSSSNNTNINDTDNNALKMTQPQQSLRRLGLCSQLAQHSSPIVFPEKRTKKVKASDPQFDHPKKDEHRIDIPVGGENEKSDLLGYVVYSGKLILDKRNTSYDKTTTIDVQHQSSTQPTSQEAVDAKLTSKALVWGSHVLSLDDVISVYNKYSNLFVAIIIHLSFARCSLLTLKFSDRYHIITASDILLFILILLKGVPVVFPVL